MGETPHNVVVYDDFAFPDIEVDGRVLMICPIMKTTDRIISRSGHELDPRQEMLRDGKYVMELAWRVVSALEKAGVKIDMVPDRSGHIQDFPEITNIERGTMAQDGVVNDPTNGSSLTSKGETWDTEDFLKTNSKSLELEVETVRKHDIRKDPKEHALTSFGGTFEPANGTAQHADISDGGALSGNDLSTTVVRMLAANTYTLLVIFGLDYGFINDDTLERILRPNTNRKLSVMIYLQDSNEDLRDRGTEIKRESNKTSFPRVSGIFHFKGKTVFAYKPKGRPMDLETNLHEVNLIATLAYGLSLGIPVQKLSSVIHSERCKPSGMIFNPIQLVKQCGQVIYTKSATRQLKRLLQRTNTKMTLTTGCFDIFHAGHAATLDLAKAQADVLVIALNSDASIKKLNKSANRPICTFRHRLRVLLALKSVDFVVVFDETKPEWVVDILDPDVFSKGQDYTVDRLRKSFPRYKHGVHISRHSYDEHTSSIIRKCKL